MHKCNQCDGERLVTWPGIISQCWRDSSFHFISCIVIFLSVGDWSCRGHCTGQPSRECCGNREWGNLLGMINESHCSVITELANNNWSWQKISNRKTWSLEACQIISISRMDLRLIYRHYYFENTWKYWQTGYLVAAAATDTGGDGFEGEGKWNRKYRLEDVIKPNQFPWDYNH